MDGSHSPTVSCLRPPAALTAADVLAGAAEHGLTVGSGYGKWKDTTLRIGHMGEVRSSDLAALFAVLDETIGA